MSEVQAQSLGEAKQQTLWDRAPAWRNLVVVASLLTCATLALPLMPEPKTHATAAVTDVTPKPHAVQMAVVPVAPPLAQPAPTHTAPHKLASVAHDTAPPLIPQAPPAPVSVPAEPAAPAPSPAPAQTASAAEPATQSNVCLMVPAPTAPRAMGMARVVSFEDHATSLARIQLTQRRNGGLIDPDYVDNLRVHVRLGNGEMRVLLVPKTMQVNIGDVITWQDGYRNTNLPCNYIPNLITSDLGPPRNLPPQQ